MIQSSLTNGTMPILPGRSIENIDLGWGPWARLGSTRCLHHLLQCKNVRFKNEDSVFPGILRGKLVQAAIAVVHDWHALGMKFESECCFTCICPVPQGHFTDADDDLCRLMHVQVTAFFVDVRFGFSHPETQQQSGPEFKDEWGKPDRGFHTGPHSQADGWYGEESEVA